MIRQISYFLLGVSIVDRSYTGLSLNSSSQSFTTATEADTATAATATAIYDRQV